MNKSLISTNCNFILQQQSNPCDLQKSETEVLKYMRQMTGCHLSPNEKITLNIANVGEKSSARSAKSGAFAPGFYLPEK